MGYGINLPDNLYSRGAVVFNTAPYLNYIQKAKANREAKQQAVDSYYQDLGKNLTSTGMAANDVPDFTDKVNKWREFVVQNRQIISNPHNPEYAKVAVQGGRLYNDAMQHASISKDKVKQLADARQFIKPNDPLTDASVLMLHNASLPVSKGYQPIDYSLLQYQPDQEKPATVEDLTKYENLVKNGLTMSEGQPSISIDPATKSKIVTTKSFYEPQAINTMARRAEMLYQTDPKFHTLVNNMSQDPNNYAALNAAYKSIYKKDIDIEHPEQFGTALLLGQTEKTNTQPYTYSPTIINNKMSDEEKAKKNQGWVKDLVDAANSGNPMAIQNTASQLFAGNQQYAKLDRTHIQDNTLYFDWQSNEFDPTKGAKGADGKPVGEWKWKKKVNSIPLDHINEPASQAMLAAFQQKLFGSTAKAESTPYYKDNKQSATQTSKSYKATNGKTYTHDQLMKLGYTEQQIPVDEYLKQLGIK